MKLAFNCQCPIESWHQLAGRGPRWPSELASLASNHRLSPLCGFESHKWQMVRTCSNMTLAVKYDIKPKLWPTNRHFFCSPSQLLVVILLYTQCIERDVINQSQSVSQSVSQPSCAAFTHPVECLTLTRDVTEKSRPHTLQIICWKETHFPTQIGSCICKLISSTFHPVKYMEKQYQLLCKNDHDLCWILLILLYWYILPSGQMHLSGVLLVSPNIRQKMSCVGLWSGPLVFCIF